MVEDFEGGVVITRYLGSEKVLKIPEKIDGKQVLKIYTRFDDIEKVKLPEGLLYISGDGWCNGFSLKEVIIPESVTDIYNGAFYDCSNLEYVELPDGLKSFDQRDPASEWARQTGLTVFGGSKDIKILYKGEIYDYSHLGALFDVIRIGKNGVDVKDGVLTNLSNAATECTIPAEVTSIAGYAFSGCDKLTSLNIPEGITSIGKSPRSNDYDDYYGGYVFKNCTSLTSITLPDSLTYLHPKTFEGSSITEITYKGKTYKINQLPNLFKAVNG